MDQQVSSDAYILLKRFSMPKGNGTVDAIALTQSHGLILVSLYTLMMKAIVTQFWAALVIIGVGMYLQKYPPETITELTASIAGLWNTRRSPRAVVILSVQQLYNMRNSRQRWHPLLWAVLAAMIVAASLAVPLFKTRSLQIGTVAPVNGRAIFVPPTLNVPDEILGLSYSVITPAAIRAVSSVGKIPQDTVFFSNVTQGTGNITIYYSYGISGTEFGLTKTPDLRFDVTGSCSTNYSWYQGPKDNLGDYLVDYYTTYGGQDNETVTNASGGPPYLVVVLPDNFRVDPFNYTFGLLVASAGRESFTQSTDPWYFTEPSNDPDVHYMISRGRPGLSCSESAVWSYRGKTSNTRSLGNLTSSELSSPLVLTFQGYLYQPMIFTLSDLLSRAALASSTTVFGDAINAEVSGVATDMRRLVNAAYMMTRNILSDSTQFDPASYASLSNVIRSPDQQTVLSRADEFVVSGPDIMTLSVRDLILIPALLGGVVLLALIFSFLPDPWRKSEELNATQLQKSKKPKKHDQGASKSQTHTKRVEVQGDDEKEPTTNDDNDIEEV